MNEIEFRNQFTVQFLATWTAIHYDDFCARGLQEELASPPVEDAEYLAKAAWDSMCTHWSGSGVTPLDLGPRPEFPSFEAWICENGSDVEREWQKVHDEYGDAAPLLSAFKEQRWREAKEIYEEPNDAIDED